MLEKDLKPAPRIISNSAFESNQSLGSDSIKGLVRFFEDRLWDRNEKNKKEMLPFHCTHGFLD